MTVVEPAVPGSSFRSTLALAGFGCGWLLAHEVGLHVLEAPGEDGNVHRLVARVSLASQPETPVPRPEALAMQAAAVLAAAVPAPTVVRRYRETPSPLVRDAVKGWRTGLLDRVLDGDFDLLARAVAPAAV
jgi:ATP-dependent Clp protease ATP-binding subunit ClpC